MTPATEAAIVTAQTAATYKVKVSFSVEKKLLLSVVSLLLLVIGFLSFSAILLLVDDKRAYTFQSQSTAAALAGKDFVGISRRSVDTLRVLMGAVDPRVPVTPQKLAETQSILENQTEMTWSSVFLAENIPTAGTPSKDPIKITPLLTASRSKEFSALHLVADNFNIPPEALKALLPELTQDSYAFVNFSKIGGPALFGVLLADLQFQTQNPGKGLPLALGIVSLRDFGAELGGLKISILTKSGRVLFDTDPAVLFQRRELQDDPLFQASASRKLASGAAEFMVDTQKYLGNYFHPGLGLVVLTRAPWEEVMKATYTLTEKFVLLGLMAIGAAIIFAIYFSKSLTAPIGRLYNATKQVAQGDFSVALKPSGTDEISALTESFGIMSHKIAELIVERMKQVQLENEVAIASAVQQNLLPPPLVKTDRFEIRSFYKSASECGGDWWGFFVSRNHLVVMIADATGHGLPAALITASARSCFSILHQLAIDDPDFTFSPAAMLSYAHRAIYDASQGRIMMTFFIAVIDLEQKQLTFSSAGHNPPWLFSKNAEGKSTGISLAVTGHRLGDGHIPPPFQEKTVPVKAGDLLFMYTDGVTEGTNAEGEMYGKKRLRRFVDNHIGEGTEGMLEKLVEDFLSYNGEKPLVDDVTVSVVELLS